MKRVEYGAFYEFEKSKKFSGKLFMDFYSPLILSNAFDKFMKRCFNRKHKINV